LTSILSLFVDIRHETRKYAYVNNSSSSDVNEELGSKAKDRGHKALKHQGQGLGPPLCSPNPFIGHIGDGLFYRPNDPTNCVKVLGKIGKIGC